MISILSFRLNGKLLGIETKYVKEINRNVEYTAVPLSPKTMIGLFNMRGQIVSLLNLAYYLGYEETEYTGKKNCIILKAQESNNQIGFLIDKTEDIFEIDEEKCEIPPANTKDNLYQFIKCVVKLEKELLLVVKNENIFI